MTQVIQLTREKSYKNLPTYRGGGPEGQGPSSAFAEKGEKDDSNVALFRTSWLAACSHLLFNVMRSMCFL